MYLSLRLFCCKCCLCCYWLFIFAFNFKLVLLSQNTFYIYKLSLLFYYHFYLSSNNDGGRESKKRKIQRNHSKTKIWILTFLFI